MSAALDVARTVVRRAERLAVASPPGRLVRRPYLNRLSDLLWAMARWTEGEHHLARPGRAVRRGGGRTADTAAGEAAGPPTENKEDKPT